MLAMQVAWRPPLPGPHESRVTGRALSETGAPDALSETGAAVPTWPATSVPRFPCETTAGLKNPVIGLCPWRADLHTAWRAATLFKLARVWTPSEAAKLRKSFLCMFGKSHATISAARATGFPVTLPEADGATAAWLELTELSSLSKH